MSAIRRCVQPAGSDQRNDDPGDYRNDDRGDHPTHDRGVVEPIPALIAAVVVCLGVSLYAGALADAVPARDREIAEPTLLRVRERLLTGGVVRPDRLGLARDAGPEGFALNVSVDAAGEQWFVGPPRPGAPGGAGGVGRRGASVDPRRTGVERARREVSVVVAPGDVRRGTLEVALWS
ncbi:MAG: hypothetical protein ABEJ74_07145 [Haloferacaceae archaeon]